jgi:hypothetical protein
VFFQTDANAKAGPRVLKFSFTDAGGEPELVAWKRIDVT